MLPHLAGIMANRPCGTGCNFNFIMSNGEKSRQREEGMKFYPFMIPENVTKGIRSVEIYYRSNDLYYVKKRDRYDGDLIVTGFVFYDGEMSVIWKIGKNVSKATIKNFHTVKMKENEVIIGVVAKLHPKWQSAYTDF